MMVYRLCFLVQALIVGVNLEKIAGKVIFGMKGYYGLGSR